MFNQHERLGQLTYEYQEHGGAVDTSTSNVVQYTYNEMAGGVNNSRLTEMTYSWWTFQFAYGGSGSVDDRISRLDEITAFGAEWIVPPTE